MTVEARTIKLMQQILSGISEEKLERLEQLLKDDFENEEILREKLTIRALKSEEDIKAGRVYTMQEAKTELNHRLGI